MKSQFKEVWLCDVCRRWFPTSQIRKVPHDALQLAGSNYLQYSDPGNSGGWDYASTVPEGKLSMGTSGDFRLKVQESTSGTPPLMGTTLLYGASTFLGPGTVNSRNSSGITPLGTWSNACFWTEVGSKEDAPMPLVVTVGLWDYATGNHIAFATYDVLEQRRIWFTFSYADWVARGYTSSDTQIYIEVSCDALAEWWLQDACLSKNITSPGVFIQTAGAVADIPTNQWTRMAVYACQKDADEVLLRRRTPGRRENRMIPPYEERET